MKDNVNHPSHYETGKFECIEVMLETQGKEAVKDFCICNAFKYIYRHNNKNGVEDIKKAKWYLDKYIEIDESKECKDPIKDRWEFINKNFHNSIERYGIDIEYGAGPSVIFVATKLEDKPWTLIDTNLPDADFFRQFTRFLCKCAREDRKKEDWVDYNVKLNRAMKNAIKEETHKVTKEKLVVSDKVLDDLVKGARKCYEDICNGTIHADNETGYDKAKAFKCDRCGVFFEFPDKIDRFTIQGEGVWAIKVYSKYDPVKKLDEFELCPNCANSFGNWLTDTKECDDE